MARITLAAIIALVTWGLALGPRQLPGQEPVPAAPAAGYLAGQQPGPVARHSMVPPTLPAREGAIPIPPPKPGARDRAPGSTSTTRGNMALVVLSSLAIVLGLFFFVVWLSRRAFPRATASLSSDVIEVLGRTPLASRHHLQLIRLGRRLLLVSVSAAARADVLGRLDPARSLRIESAEFLKRPVLRFGQQLDAHVGSHLDGTGLRPVLLARHPRLLVVADAPAARRALGGAIAERDASGALVASDHVGFAPGFLHRAKRFQRPRPVLKTRLDVGPGNALVAAHVPLETLL